jgi:hypothetical protein
LHILKNKDCKVSKSVSQGSQNRDLTKTLIVLILAAVAALIYVVSVFLAYQVFQDTRLTDPLAEIHSLYPLYYIAIALAGLSVVVCVLWRVGNRCIHVLLLMLFAVMLWLTPYLLTSFVRLGDSAWHVGVAMNIPQVLDGEQTVFSNYGWDYPGSFIYHYSFVKILGIQPLTYIHFYPLICTLLFVILCYALVARLFSSKVALLSMLIAIPGLHYLQLHASPHTIGALLMLTALLLLIQRGAATRIIALAVILILIIIITHPTTPLLLAIFLAAALLIGIVYSRRISGAQVALAALLIICFAGWFIWNSFYPSQGMSAATIYEGMMPDGFSVGTGYLSGTRFVYSDIYNLNKGIYFLYAAVAALAILYIFARTYLEKRSVGKWICGLGGLNRIEALLALSVLPLLLLSFLLAENAHDLIETGLTYIILSLAVIIASVIVRSYWINRRTAASFLMAGVLFLTLSFPIVAYSIDAYSSVPRSEEAGLSFLAAEGDLGGKTVTGWNLKQLALYSQPYPNQTQFVLLYSVNSQNLDEVKPDVVVFRNTGYYYAAMRNDLSFEDNSYTRLLAAVESSRYDRIYSSPTFEVYLKDRLTATPP